MAKDHPSFMGDAAMMPGGPNVWGSGMLADAIVSAVAAANHAVDAAILPPSMQLLQSAGLAVSSSTPQAPGVPPGVIMLPNMCAAKPPPTSSSAPRSMGALRLGSGSFRINGKQLAATLNYHCYDCAISPSAVARDHVTQNCFSVRCRSCEAVRQWQAIRDWAL